jgi:glycosyltransferase involved in cell wall biosynthesis
MKYRVLMIAPTPFFADRGCHVRMLGEIRALQEEGCDVTLCTYHNGRDIPGVRTVRIPRVPWYKKLAAGPSNHKYYLDLLLLWKSLTTALRLRPDVIHAHLHEGAAIGRVLSTILRRPLVFDYQGSLTDELASHEYARRDGLVLKAMAVLERWIDRGADAVVPSSSRAGNLLHCGRNGQRIVVVPDGVDTSVFRPLSQQERLAVRRRVGLPEDAVLAVFVGVLTPYQGIDLFLEHAGHALDAAPNLHVAVVGFPEGEYVRRAAELGLSDRVTFMGKVAFENTALLTAAADIGLTPKISASEGNLKIYNYLACGLPVLAFDNPVNREILGELGIYAPLGDGSAFAANVASMANHPVRREALAQAGREYAVEHLSWRRAARQLLDVYGDVGATPSLPHMADPPGTDTVLR